MSTTVRLASTDELLGAIGRARSVALASYILRPGRLLEALEAAAERGARVEVRLAAEPIEDGDRLATENRRLARELAAHGARVTFAPPEHPSHLKAAVVDGQAFLDDRNWPDDGHDLIVADADRDDVAVVRGAISGRARSDPHLWSRKSEALRGEAELIGAAQRAVDCESESFGYGAVERALEAKAQAGIPVRLLVSEREARNAREAAVLRRLAEAGVAVRTARREEKLAVSGEQGWVGSANATAYPGFQLDWGMRTRLPAMVAALRARFEENWALGAEFA